MIMPKECRHIAGLHPIILQNAEAQALFVFVRGVLAISPEASVTEAIRLFENEFGLEDFNRKSAKVRYYRMLESYMKNTKLFAHDTRTTSGNGKVSHVLAKSVGTVAAT